MGAWGYGPLDSDQALDWKGSAIEDHIKKEIVKAMKKTGKNFWPADAYAAVGLLDMMTVEGQNEKIRSGVFWFPGASYKMYAQGLKALDRIEDHRWIDEWGNTSEILAQIDKLRKSLQRKYDSQTGEILGIMKDDRRTGTKPQDWFLEEHAQLIRQWEREGIL